jgi:FAD-NAD(P)-binding
VLLRLGHSTTGPNVSGSIVSPHSLRMPPATPTDIVLAERGSAIGRGMAYASHEFPYLLNVPAARLSADSRDPLQFLRFARATGGCRWRGFPAARPLRRLFAGSSAAGGARGASAHQIGSAIRRGDEHQAVRRREASGGVIRAARAHTRGFRRFGARRGATAAAGVGRKRFASPRVPPRSARFAEQSCERAFGCHCRQRLDHGGRRACHGVPAAAASLGSSWWICWSTQPDSSNHLFYLGPMLRADHWEATAALELRDHAEHLAAHLLEQLGS